MSLQDDVKTASASFAKLDRIDPDGPLFHSICALLDRADDTALIAIHDANIKFVSNLALNRIIWRGLVRIEVLL